LGRWRSLGAEGWGRGGCAKQGETDNEFVHGILLDLYIRKRVGEYYAAMAEKVISRFRRNQPSGISTTV
jgi:hypothetical protein